MWYWEHGNLRLSGTNPLDGGKACEDTLRDWSGRGRYGQRGQQLTNAPRFAERRATGSADREVPLDGGTLDLGAFIGGVGRELVLHVPGPRIWWIEVEGHLPVALAHRFASGSSVEYTARSVVRPRLTRLRTASLVKPSCAAISPYRSPAT